MELPVFDSVKISWKEVAFNMVRMRWMQMDQKFMDKISLKFTQNFNN